MPTYVCSDIHGYAELFYTGLKRIDFNESRDYLYILGDVIDRGPDGMILLTYIKNHQDCMDTLIGNHELLMLNSVSLRGLPFCTGPQSELWLDYNGGRVTFEAYRDLSREERKDLLDWLNSRYLIKTLEVNNQQFILTHSNYLPECENKKLNEVHDDEAWSIAWKSMFRSEPEVQIPNIYQNYSEKMFITGHVPVFRVSAQLKECEPLNPVFIEPNLYNIDGGCSLGKSEFFRNGLIFLRLDDMQVFPIYFNEVYKD